MRFFCSTEDEISCYIFDPLLVESCRVVAKPCPMLGVRNPGYCVALPKPGWLLQLRRLHPAALRRNNSCNLSDVRTFCY